MFFKPALKCDLFLDMSEEKWTVIVFLWSYRERALQHLCGYCFGSRSPFVGCKWHSFLAFHYLSNTGDPVENITAEIQFRLSQSQTGRSRIVR